MPTKAELELQVVELKRKIFLTGICAFVFGSGGLFGFYQWWSVDKSLGEAQRALAEAQTRESTINGLAEKVRTLESTIEKMASELQQANLTAEAKAELKTSVDATKVKLKETIEELSQSIK